MSRATEYWRQTRRLTFLLLACWAVVTFGLTWYARQINEFIVLGFPLGFYMAAQGALVIYLLLIWIYNRAMKRLDTRFGIEDD